jgi:hypothetical protein
MEDFIEIKKHKNKPDQQFSCTLLHREPDHVVLRYFSETPGLIADIPIAASSTTIAHYWTQRPYAAWRMFDQRSCLIGTLFHICSNVYIDAASISYEDLLLDIWIAHDSSLRVLDEDEVQTCTAAGLITNEELRHIRHAHHCIITDHAPIMSELKAFEKNNPNALLPNSSSASYSA